MPLAKRADHATLLEEKRNPPLNRAIRSCEGLLLKHNVRYENNKHYLGYERYKHKNYYKNYAFIGVSLVYNIRKYGIRRISAMAKKEVKTDLWVASQLKDCNISFDAQGSNIKEIDNALKTASKRGTGNAGYPEYVAVVNDFVLVIEDKADTSKQVKFTGDGVLDLSVKAITDYAVNGAYFYAKHIAQNTSFHKIFAIGVSGDAKHHVISPLYVDDREGYMELDNLDSFTMFSAQNIYEYYLRNVLKEKTDVEKTTEQILKDAAELHEYLRTYGTVNVPPPTLR